MAKVFEGVPPVVPVKPDEGVQSQLPEELKGKSAEEVFSALSTEHTKVMTEAELKHQTELANRPAAVEEPKPVPRPAPVPAQQAQEEEPDFLTDPDGFMEQQFNKRLEPLARQTVESQKATNREVFWSKAGNEDFEKYGGEVDDFINKLHPMLQGNFKSYEAAYDYVRSRHVDEISETMAEKKATVKLMEVLQKKGLSSEEITQFIGSDKPAPEPAPSTGLFRPVTGLQQIGNVRSTPFNPEKVKARVTDPKERAIMAEFDMTDEEYIEYRDQNSDAFSELARRSK